MPSVKDIKDRVGSIRDTQKITNAMYLISSIKLQKAKRDLAKTKPYFDILKEEIKRIYAAAGEVNSRYMEGSEAYRDKGRRKRIWGILVITADKGLAGAYNSNVLKLAQQFISENEDSRVYVVGEFGRRYFIQHELPFVSEFDYPAMEPRVKRAREMCLDMLEDFDGGIIDGIRVVYSDMVTAMEAEAKCMQLLPLQEEMLDGDGSQDSRGAAGSREDEEAADGEKGSDHESSADYTDCRFLPDALSVLESVIPGILTGFIYSALVDSYCCEQNARMSAMDNANRNADEILSELGILYNRVRQAEITQEITEVSAGAKAQKKKRQKMLEANMKKLQAEGIKEA